MFGNENTGRSGEATATVPAAPAQNGKRQLRRVAPAVDIFEHEEKLYLVADMPGVSIEDVKLDVDKDVLTISARFEGAAAFPGRASYSELSPVEYYRAFALGEDLDAGKISAKLKDGVLELVLPKAERAKTRKISVKAE